MSLRISALLVTTALVSAGASLPAVAQPSSPEKEQETAQAAVRTFSIPPQPLAEALILFGRQSGLQVTANSSMIQGLSTPGVSGTMSREQALNTLLSGTGLVYRINGAMVALERPGPSGAIQLDPVQVQAFAVPSQAMIDNLPPPYAGGQVATGGQLGLLGNRDVMDTPFNQTSYTAKKAQDQQARTMRDVLIDDPSVRSYWPDGGSTADAMYIRGFPVFSGDAAYGGMYGILPYNSIMVEMAERVELLKGPSAMLNGMAPTGSLGGTINIVPKRAPNDPLTQVTASYASSAQFGGHADVARRFGPENQLGVRFNGVFKAGQTAVENNADQRGLGLLGLDFRGEGVRLSADLGYQSQVIDGVLGFLGVAPGVALPNAPSARTNQGQPWGYQFRKDLFGVVRAEVDVTDRITAYASFGAHDYRLAGLYSANITASGFSGAATSSAPLNLSMYRTYLTAEAGARALVETGPIGHEIALTATTFANEVGVASALGTAFATNIYNPTVTARPNIATPVANKTSTSNLSSLAIADTLSVAAKRVQLTLGARLQQVKAANFNVTSGAQTTSYDQSALSPSVSLVVKPFWENVTFYGNWIQGLQQGAIVQAPFTNAGEIFPPYKTTQYEAGVKVDWGKLTTTASIFQIAQPSILVNTTANTQFLGGEQVNQGLELNFFGEVTEGIRVLGGAMFLSAVLAKTQGGLTNGWIAPFSPGAQFNLGAEWDVPFAKGLTVNGRVLYTGAQFIDTTTPRRSLPEWTRFDAGLRYAFENPGAKDKLLVARFNVENLFDNSYWAGGSGATFLNLGAPRIFRLALTADF